MTKVNSVDEYLAIGCGRCKYAATPACKVHLWTKELVILREIALSCGLVETIKWGVPCYTFQGKNILLIAAFKQYFTVSFFKGALLLDEEQILVKPGENTQAARNFNCSSSEELITKLPILKQYIFEAIELEKSGQKIETNQITQVEYPNELIHYFQENTQVQQAFEQLTPGRQRAYLIYFNQAKQSKTKISRIEKCASSILNGKGLNE